MMHAIMKRLSIPIAAVFMAQALFAATPPSVAEARKFIEDAEARLLALSVDASRADWVKSTYSTDDTEALAAKDDERLINATAVGSGAGRCIFPCTPMCDESCGKSTARMWCPRMARFQRTCWATHGRSSGTILTRWWPRRAPIRASISPKSNRPPLGLCA